MGKEVLPEYGADGTSMPRWKCHKEVSAFKIREIRGIPGADIEDPGPSSALLVSTDGGTVTVTAEYMRKHRPQIGGYYILYEDGYHSFSPAKAFEDGYARIPDPPAAPVPSAKRSCNRHDDCGEADKTYLSIHTKERFTPANFHCHNDECEDCFGN